MSDSTLENILLQIKTLNELVNAEQIFEFIVAQYCDIGMLRDKLNSTLKEYSKTHKLELDEEYQTMCRNIGTKGEAMCYLVFEKALLKNDTPIEG